MKQANLVSRVAVALVLAVFALAGCTDEKIVFRDREPFNPPPDAASGFLGYYTASTKQTTCGNCHVGHQADWVTSAHADAYATLANSGHAQSFCYGCHTVSEMGNAVDTAAGWNVVADEAYHDVQCENCHGPGFDHVSAPDTPGNVPLAHVGILGADSAASCAACHSGAHHPFAEEWSQTGHAGATREPDGTYVVDASSSCGSCHEGRAALASWGVTANYVEKGAAGSANYLGFTCSVCHDPHGSPNSGQLRFAIDAPDPNNNLCMKCHSRRYEPAANSSRGPHAPQGAVLFGTAGWWPAGYDTTAVAATHANTAANPRLCAGCHVNSYSYTDTLTGATVFSTGHLFAAIPCLDANGAPVHDNSCAFNATARSFDGCVASGCHSSEATAASAFNSNRAVIAVLADQIWIDNPNGAANEIGVVDANDTGILAQVPLTEFSTADNVITVAEGVLFNMRLVAEDRYENGDKSDGAHNPFLAQALLAASLQALNDTYGPFPAPAKVTQVLNDVNQRLLQNRRISAQRASR